VFAMTPLVPRAALRVPPVATLTLVVAIAAVSAWSVGLPEPARQAAGSTAPLEHWGYRAGAPWVQSLSALLVHADWLHLLANLVPLAIAGACLEQVWGGGRTFLLFFAAGSAAIAFEAVCVPSGGLIVGASAGVSALLGACFVRFRHRRLRFAYVYLEYVRPRSGRFQLSCAAIGVGWALQQAIGVIWSAASGDTSTAFVSHLAGTGVGAAVALALESI